MAPNTQRTALVPKHMPVSIHRAESADGRTCTQCGEYKPWDTFVRAKNRWKGLCKPCHAANERAARKTDRTKKSLLSSEEGQECRICHEFKSWGAFHKDSRYASGRSTRCKECRKKYDHNWYAKDPEYIIEYRKHYYRNNKATCRKRARDYERLHMQTDPTFRFAKLLRGRMRMAFRKRTKTGSAVAALGCSVDEAMQHISSQFEDGMSWDNWGVNGWHIDHIKPLSSFDLSDPEQLKVACHYTNLQPLWACDNMSKGAKYDV